MGFDVAVTSASMFSVNDSAVVRTFATRTI